MFTIPVAGLSPITEVVTHHNRINPTDQAIYGRIQTVIESIISAGLWDNVIQLCIIHDTAADSLLDIKGNVDALNTIGCTFTAGQGFTINATDYINSNYIPSNHDNVLHPSSHNAFVCTNNRVIQFTGYLFGIYYNTLNSCDINSNEFLSCFVDYQSPTNNTNVAMSLNFSTTDANVTKESDFVMVNRTSTANNSVSILTDVDDVTSIAIDASCDTFTFDQEILYGAANDLSTVSTITRGSAALSVFGICTGMSVTDCKTLRTIIQTYLTAMGI